jgi:hypothetical protein
MSPGTHPRRLERPPLLDAAQRGVLALEGPGDEAHIVPAGRGSRDARVARDGRGDLAGPEVEQGPVLPLADEPHVVDAVGVALDVPEHHRCAGVHAQRVGDIHRRQPRLGGALAQPDLAADGWREDLAAAAREAVEPRLLQADHDPADLLFQVGAGRVEEVDELDELGRAERVDVDAREALLDLAEQVEVPVEGQLGVHAALQEDLRAADRAELGDLLEQLLLLERVRIVVRRVAAERAEGALGGAHIGVVDVAVDHIGPDVIAVDRSAARVRVPPQRVEGRTDEQRRAPARASAGPRRAPRRRAAPDRGRRDGRARAAGGRWCGVGSCVGRRVWGNRRGRRSPWASPGLSFRPRFGPPSLVSPVPRG